jgi:hypothetical protein
MRFARRLALAALLGGAALSLGGGCGARTPLIVELSCTGDPLPVETDLPELYFVLDRSFSMTFGRKWDRVREVVVELVIRMGPRARFGLAAFPAEGEGSCAAGVELVPITPGDPTAGVPGALAARFEAALSVEPAGGTPTAATLRELAGRLGARKNAYVILATDGGPNCNADLQCPLERCILNVEGVGSCSPTGPSCCEQSRENCLDDENAISAVRELLAVGVPTFVVGIPGSDLYGPVLGAMAREGGTARPGEPAYYRVDAVGALLDTLEEIADRITRGCELRLVRAPAHPEGVRLWVRGAEIGFSGFSVTGRTLRLGAEACSAFAGDAASIVVRDGCVPVPGGGQ